MFFREGILSTTKANTNIRLTALMERSIMSYLPDSDYWYSFVPSLTVIPEDEPEYSGLVDMNGNPLVRHREPIGFIHFDRKRHRDTNQAGV